MIDRIEAAEALRTVDQVHHRTSAAGAYSYASPHLLLSGFIWTIGYIATAMTQPAQWAIVWIPLVLAGLLGSFVITLRSRRPDHADPAVRMRFAMRGLCLAASLIVFIES